MQKEFRNISTVCKCKKKRIMPQMHPLKINVKSKLNMLLHACMSHSMKERAACWLTKGDKIVVSSSANQAVSEITKHATCKNTHESQSLK